MRPPARTDDDRPRIRIALGPRGRTTSFDVSCSDCGDVQAGVRNGGLAIQWAATHGQQKHKGEDPDYSIPYTLLRKAQRARR